ncbi:MAG TPA: TIGR01440 family protein [Pseudogracilibacillus sp.]|nr:TIGR01440 family protein [Pseudogracilibacillus sp.]
MHERIKNDMEHVVDEWIASDFLEAGDLFVVGCSTSEVAGKQIGTSGSEEIAKVLFESLQRLAKEKKIHLAFQCCEHLNRAIVIERAVQEKLGMDRVTVIPTPSAGGSMASYAYSHFNDAVVVEEIEAHAGMDIGDTMIGMHLKKVAVPLRFETKAIGNAHLTLARTRPKLIGGERARYS